MLINTLCDGHTINEQNVIAQSISVKITIHPFFAQDHCFHAIVDAYFAMILFLPSHVH